MNFIPQQAGKSPNYWCTWSTQNWGRKEINTDYRAFVEGVGSKAAREAMNEEYLEKWLLQFPEICSDLYLMLDDGWDIPYGIHRDKNMDAFGSLMLDEERFPSFRGTPGERLKKLNNHVKAAGWRGLSLWIPAQPAGEVSDGEEMERYWKERISWCKEAGVEYWKVDWGIRSRDVEYRRRLSNLAREEYPQLVIEHAYCMTPYNGVGLPDETNPQDRFSQMRENEEKSREIHRFSEVFRTYDVFNQLCVSTTIDRTAWLLQSEGGLLNCEDNVILSASLGCCAGVMRSKYWGEIPRIDYDSLLLRKQLNEVTGAIRWQRLAPAFTGTKTIASDETLTDVWYFNPGECWVQGVYNKELRQTAPAIVARNMELPEISFDDVQPFVTCSRNPNGAMTVAVFGRLLPNHELVYPKADIILKQPDILTPVGIFGYFNSITLETKADIPENTRFYLQSLLSYEAIDITEKIIVQKNRYTLPGDLAEAIYKASVKEQDSSHPTVMIQAVV